MRCFSLKSVRTINYLSLSLTNPCTFLLLVLADTRVEHDTALDAFQMYEWQYCSMAWGSESREYADAIVRNKNHDALGRFDNENLVAAIELLDHFDLRRAYFGSDSLPQWIVDAQKKVTKKASKKSLKGSSSNRL